jgi:hypothetical protein
MLPIRPLDSSGGEGIAWSVGKRRATIRSTQHPAAFAVCDGHYSPNDTSLRDWISQRPSRFQHLKMHPFVIMVSVLAGASLLGPVGVLIALPGAAVVQGLIEELAGAREEGGSGEN